MVFWGTCSSVLGCQNVLEGSPRFHRGFTKVPPRFFKFRSVFGFLGQIRLGLPKGSALSCLTHAPPVRRKRPIISLLLGYSLGLFHCFFRWSLLQLHHVPGDSALVQWCPQKLDSKEILFYESRVIQSMSLWFEGFVDAVLELDHPWHTKCSHSEVRSSGPSEELPSSRKPTTRNASCQKYFGLFWYRDLRFAMIFYSFDFTFTHEHACLSAKVPCGMECRLFLLLPRLSMLKCVNVPSCCDTTRRNSTQVFPRQSRALLETMHACYTFLRLELITKQSQMQHM